MRSIVLALLLTVVFAVPAFSQMRGMPMMGHREGRGQMMEMGDMMMGMCLEYAEKIGLTDEQMVKMKAAHYEMQKKQARYKADRMIAKIELMEIMEVKDFDLEKASSGVKKIETIKTAHQLEMLKAMKEMRTALSDEQFKKMKTMMPMGMGEEKPAEMMMKP